MKEKDEFLDVFKHESLGELPLNFQMIRKVFETNKEETIKDVMRKKNIYFERVSTFHQTNCYSVKKFYKPVSNLI